MTTADPTDALLTRLFECISGGSQEAFTELYAAHFAQTLRSVATQTGSNLHAERPTLEEALQDAFLEAHQAILAQRLKARTQGAFRWWIVCAAKHRYLDAVKKRRAITRGGDRTHLRTTMASSTAGMDIVDANARPSIPMHAAEREAQLHAAMASLRPTQRQVFDLHYNCGMSRSEIAAELGMKEVTIGSHLHRARARLQEELPNWIVR